MTTEIETIRENVKRPWMTGDISELKALRASGHNYQQIVEKTGRTMGSVASMLRRLGLQKSCVKTHDSKPRPVARPRPVLPPPQTVFMNPADKRAGR